MNIYLIGIKGTGMSALACLLADLGHHVRGSDVSRYIFTQEKLKEKGIICDSLEDPKYDQYPYVVLGNTFWKQSLVEQFKKEKKTIFTYQEMIRYLANQYPSIAICGTHGKTTTAHLIETMLSANHTCSYIIGDGEGKGKKDADYFIFEACEYEDNFLNYTPNIIVLSNIDFDHVDYFKSQKQYNQSFLTFLNQCKDFVILNQDDAITVALKPFIHKPYYTYAIEAQADVMAKEVVFNEQGVSFIIEYQNQRSERMILPIYGKHLFYDALSSIALGLILHQDLKTMIQSLSFFKPAHRRFNISEVQDNVIVDDYGHHPFEIQQTILSIKQKYPHKKLKVVFHPDRYSRIQYFYQQYVDIFQTIDEVYIIPFIGTLPHSKEEALLTQFLKYPNIHFIQKDIFEKEYHDVVFLFTGSKDMSYLIQPFLNHLSLKKTYR